MRFHLVSLFILFINITYSQTSTAPSVGDGSVGNPYQITTLNNLYWLTQNSSQWNKYFVQTANIDASSSSTWASGSGFNPIGNSTTKFSGNYNGSGFRIIGIRINRSSSDNIGFIGYTSSTAVIESVMLQDLNVTGRQYIGGLVGFMGGGTISNCATSGTVSSTTDGTSFGGLVGLMWGNSGNCLIKKSYSLVNVTGGGYNLGGLVGGCWGNTTSAQIEDCFSRGNVTRIAGSTDANNCAAFCGYNNGGKIIRSYSTGNVFFSGTSNPTSKGFIGVNSGTATDNFWDNDLSNQNTANGATSKTTAEMKVSQTYTNWDFVNTWSIDNQKNDGYPHVTASYSPLPVAWLNFIGKKLVQGIELNWSTSTEQNTKDFQVQHSINAQQWTAVGNLPAAGNSSTVRNYRFVHEGPFKASIQHYYRILQRDLDGKFSYSKVIRIEYPEASPDVVLYPNPAKEVLLVNLTERQEMRLVNMQGVVVWKGVLPAGRHEIPVSNFATGNYILQTERGAYKVVID